MYVHGHMLRHAILMTIYHTVVGIVNAVALEWRHGDIWDYSSFDLKCWFQCFIAEGGLGWNGGWLLPM